MLLHWDPVTLGLQNNRRSWLSGMRSFTPDEKDKMKDGIEALSFASFPKSALKEQNGKAD